jgi:hypothetical protein
MRWVASAFGWQRRKESDDGGSLDVLARGKTHGFSRAS